ncbi:hypothetical protein E2B89_23515 [Salmonella enterica]|uniref:Uncharacterized protein n=1 Tax=Salmonella enterica subsp. diarizonae serovar 48:i:z TaxID=1192842 RepID=A0A735RM30_SALDZ|nr:hypothetical protein [Salmonella enterica]EBD2218551.1 hypothetical protein [Salmonella enterica subsp. enterica]EBP3746814.1 hypothetical protein [Salmonella enterica subsp. arizonae]EBQ6946736.1 hypothetical protein [Salmonella enterica subsp. diarizonae]EDN5753117.1 hypothetical protein [Salmonella enterica subsp. diarizonae serovar 48:i:z]EDS4379988.1 hypothetical protein [Salmonella enterica subsp. diarizonae serovar 16:z10:e,n,x,z15]EDS4951387.1 hypothetical protein [Salmonella enter
MERLGELFGTWLAGNLQEPVITLFFFVTRRKSQNGRLLPVSRFFMVSWSATETDQGERLLPHFRPALTSLPAAQALAAG